MKEWGRLITAMATPMYDDGSVNFEGAVKLAKHIVSTGSTALVVSGTTGESPTLNQEEKLKLFTLIKEKLNVPVIAGIGTNDTRASVQNAINAQKCGVDGLLAVVPYYNKPNQKSLYAHFEAINDAVSAPVMLYNVPGRTGINMDAKTSVALSKLKNITALKEASGDLVQLASVVRDCEQDFVVYTGEDSQILPTLAVGGYGVVSVAAQVCGVKIAHMIKSYVDGQPDEAAKTHLELIEICAKLFMTANPIPVKAALNLMGLEAGPTRLPLLSADDDVKTALKEALGKLGLA